MTPRRSSWAWFFLWSLALSLASPVPVPKDERALAQNADGDSAREVVVLSELSPEELFGPELETRGAREKRKLSWVLDLIFWKFNKILELKTWVLSGFSSRSRKRPTSTTASIKGVTAPTEEPPLEFEGNRISLVLPDELFGSAFTVITDVSKIVGSVIQNSARRTKTFFDALKPIFRNALGIRSTTSAVLGNRVRPVPMRPSPPPSTSSTSTTAAEGATDSTEADSTEKTEDSTSGT